MTTTFMNLPINGDIVRGDRQVPQRPESEFTPIIQAVLSDPKIQAVSWYQYTPYFNDGEPCVFGASSACPEPIGAEMSHEDRREGWPPYGEGMREVFGYRDWRNGNVYHGADVDLYDSITALANAIEGGAFDEVLLEKFGDHAEVRIVANDGIYVEFYEHE